MCCLRSLLQSLHVEDWLVICKLNLISIGPLDCRKFSYPSSFSTFFSEFNSASTSADSLSACKRLVIYSKCRITHTMWIRSIKKRNRSSSEPTLKKSRGLVRKIEVFRPNSPSYWICTKKLLPHWSWPVSIVVWLESAAKILAGAWSDTFGTIAWSKQNFSSSQIEIIMF